MVGSNRGDGGANAGSAYTCTIYALDGSTTYRERVNAGNVPCNRLGGDAPEDHGAAELEDGGDDGRLVLLGFGGCVGLGRKDVRAHVCVHADGGWPTNTPRDRQVHPTPDPDTTHTQTKTPARPAVPEAWSGSWPRRRSRRRCPRRWRRCPIRRGRRRTRPALCINVYMA